MAVEIARDLSASLRYAREQRDFWTKTYNGLVNDAEKLAGEDPELTVDGKVVFTNNPTANFQGAKFKKDEPDAAAFYTRKRTVEEEYLDLDGLKRSRPELFKRYQSRSFRVVED